MACIPPPICRLFLLVWNVYNKNHIPFSGSIWATCFLGDSQRLQLIPFLWTPKIPIDSRKFRFYQVYRFRLNLKLSFLRHWKIPKLQVFSSLLIPCMASQNSKNVRFCKVYRFQKNHARVSIRKVFYMVEVIRA